MNALLVSEVSLLDINGECLLDLSMNSVAPCNFLKFLHMDALGSVNKYERLRSRIYCLPSLLDVLWAKITHIDVDISEADAWILTVIAKLGHGRSVVLGVDLVIVTPRSVRLLLLLLHCEFANFYL